MKIAIAGAGAVGSVVAWHLARAGAAPTIVARPTTVDAIAHYGLTLSGTKGPETVAINTTDRPAALGACDVVFTGFKAHDYPHALALVRPLFGAKTVVVPLLNGIPWWYFERQTGPFAGYRMQALDADGAIAAAIPALRSSVVLFIWGHRALARRTSHGTAACASCSENSTVDAATGSGQSPKS